VVSGGQGVVRVLVTLNGLEVARLDEKTPQRALPLNLALRLQEGPNTLVVTATEADGSIHQEVRTVHYERRIPSPSPSATPRTRPAGSPTPPP